jgi:drug/metabolite transporter (DMT)-like permease
MPYMGEAAGLGAAILWSWTALLFTAAGNRIGPAAVNLLRVTMAVPLLAATLLLTAGADIGTWFAGGRPWLLALSGLIGLAIGDGALFKAYVLLGPRKTTLMMSLAPPMTALGAYLFIGEVLTLTGWLGMILTVGGVAWVVGPSTARRWSAGLCPERRSGR